MVEHSRGAHMSAEIASIPTVVARQLAEHGAAYARIGSAWRENQPVLYVTCARGTSDQAALFFKYLTEIHTGIPVASLGPSLASVYRAPLHLPGAALVTISQSGASPDITALLEAGRRGGARALALVNTPDSPLAQAADDVLPIGAGPELAVAATKSFVASLVALTAIHAARCDDRALAQELTTLPDALDRALSRQMPDLEPLVGARTLFCLGRGLGLAVAGEAALKLKETCLMGAEAMSSAEFRHGPLALARAGTAALMFAGNDASRAGNEEVAAVLRDAGATVIMAGVQDGAGHPALDAIAQITGFYASVLRLSLALGHDPDRPPHLLKATLTV